jgi:hypothetical protein
MYKLRPDIQIEITNFAENAENVKNNAAGAHLRCVPFFTDFGNAICAAMKI